MNAPPRPPATQSRADRERARTPTARSGGMWCDGAWNEARKRRARQKIWKRTFCDLEPLQPLEIPQNHQSFLLAETQAEFGELAKGSETRHHSAGKLIRINLCPAVILATFLNRASTLARGATRIKRMSSSQAILGAEGRRRTRKNGAGLSLGQRKRPQARSPRSGRVITGESWARLRRADRRWPRGRCLVRASIQWERSIRAD
jgi:hypothetical protein